MEKVWNATNLFFDSNLWNNALLPIVTIGLITLLVGYFLNKRLEEFRNNLQKDKEQEIFIREVTINEKESLLRSWTELLIDMDKAIKGVSEKKLTEKYIEMTMKAVMYGSSRLIVLAMMYQKYSNKTMYVNNSQKQNFKLIVYVAMMVSELKKEFSGVVVDPLTLMQMKITDYDESEEEFKKAKKEIEEEIESYMKEQDTH